jgi:hypothetical protein
MSLLHRHSVLVVFPFVQALFVRDSQLSACGVQVETDRCMSGVGAHKKVNSNDNGKKDSHPSFAIMR